MSLNSEKNSKFLNIFLWLVIVAVVAAGVVANFYFAYYAVSIRLIGWLAITIVVVLLALQTTAGALSWEFIKQARNEMRKVTWPTRQETVQTSLVVIGMVVLMSLILWGIDSILLWLIGMLTGQSG